MINRSRQPERFLATILFIDIVGSTDLAARLGDREWRRVLGAYYDAVRRQLKQFGGREVDTSGDGFFASFEHPAQAVRAADAILADVSRLSLGLRAGIHTGECEMIGRKVGGIAVHIAARVMAAADSGEVLVSNTVRELVSGSGLEFGDRGTHELKGVPGEWHLYALVRQQPDAAPADGGSAVPAAEAGASRGRSRRGVLVGALAIAIVGLVGLAAVVALAGRGGSAAAIPPGPDTVVTLAGDSGAVVEVRQVPAGPVTIAADTDRLWVGSLDAGVVSSLPTGGSGGAGQQIGRVGLPTGLAVGNGQAWSADAFDQTITLIETATGAVNKTISGVLARQIEFGGGSGWAADDLSDSIHRLDGQSGDSAATIALDAGAFPRALAVGPDSVWVANAGTSTVARIDLKTSAITAEAIPLRYVPDAIAAGPKDVWIASSASDTLLRLDPATNAVAATTPVCDQPTAVAADGGGVWVACRGTHEVWHLDHAGAVLSTTDVGGEPTDIVVLGGRVFVTVRR